MFLSAVKRKILVVENDDLIANLIEYLLQNFGFEFVGHANTAELAIELADKLRPDLILMDIQLDSSATSDSSDTSNSSDTSDSINTKNAKKQKNGLDGIGAAQIIYAQNAIPVVFIVGNYSKETLKRAAQSNAFGYIAKPFVDHELRTVIEMALYKHEVETKLQLSKLALEAISQGVIITDPHQQILSTNIAFRKQVGYTNEELVGQNCSLIHGPLSNPKTLHEINFAISEKRSFYGEILNYRKNGSVFLSEISITPRFNERDELTHYILTNNDITERKNTLEELRQSENDLLETERITHVGHWTWNIQTKKVNYSSEMERIWQRDLSVFELNIFELFQLTVHPEDQSFVLESCHEAFEDKIHHDSIEYRIAVPDGSFRTVWAKIGNKHFNEHGDVVRVTGTVQDVTQRKQKEKNQRVDDALMEQAFGKSPIGMVLINIQGRILRVNQSLSNMIGFEEEELLLKDWRRFAHPEDLYTDRQLMADLLEGKIPSYQFEKRMLHKDLHEVWVQLNVSLVNDQSGSPLSIIVQIQDITKKRVDEVHIRQLSQAIEQSKDAIALCNINGEIEYVNETFINNSACDKSDIIGTNFAPIAAEKSPQDQFNLLWSNLHAGSIWRGDFATKMLDGSEKIEFVTVSPIRQTDGKITHFVSIQEDITEKKKLGQELDRHRHHLEELVETRTQALGEAQKLAEAANLAKSQFIANMSHEIRTPMNGVLGMAYLALSNATDVKQRDYLEKINSSGEHLLRIVDDILDFSKIEAGKMKIELADFSVNELMHKVQNLVHTKVEARKLNLMIEIDPSLPKYLHGDSHRLSQVLLNYINNAIKFTEKGDISVKLQKLNEDDSGCLLRIEVKDTGIGMNAEQKNNLFQSFEQADSSTTRKYGGTGLGLAICKQVARMMHGEVGVESALNKGSTFWCTAFVAHAKEKTPITDHLQHIEDACTELKLFNAVHHQRLDQAPCKQLHILLVDDNDFNQQIGQELLQAANCVVTLANNGKEALDFILGNSHQHFDCVLMDIQMPVMDGLEATRQIRQHSSLPNLPIIAMTANAMSEDKIQCLSVGMNDFISKPFTPDTLYKTVLRWVTQNISLMSKEYEVSEGSEESGGSEEHNQLLNENDETLKDQYDGATKMSEKTRALESDNDSENLNVSSAIHQELSIDLNVLAVLVNHSPEKIEQFAWKFLESITQGLMDFSTALCDKKLKDINALGHKLKSSARTVGAFYFSNLCAKLEVLKDEHAFEKAKILIQELNVQANYIERDIRAYFDQQHTNGTQFITVSRQTIQETFYIQALVTNPTLDVLVLEDDQIENALVCDNLKRLGIKHISSCLDGSHAMAIFKSKAPDFLICDLNMAGMDGITFLRLIADEQYKGGIIVLSSADKSVMRAAENLVKAYGLNLLASISKPFALKEVVQAMNKQVNLFVQRPTFTKTVALTIDELQEGLDHHYIEVYFQPKVSIKNNRIKGAECLARWRHPSRGLLYPDAFINAIEESHLIDAFTLEILRLSAAQLRAWNDQGHQLCLAVNISMDNLNQADLPEQFEKIICDAGLQPSQFILELTETRLMDNLTLSLEVLTRLRLKGFALSIDDFGTGFSTMENLKQLPFTELKVDRSFVNNACNDEAAIAILNSSVQLGKIFHLNLVAEGVENQDDWDLIAQSGCDDIQGYFLTKPLPADAFIEWCDAWNQKTKVL